MERCYRASGGSISTWICECFPHFQRVCAGGGLTALVREDRRLDDESKAGYLRLLTVVQAAVTIDGEPLWDSTVHFTPATYVGGTR